MRGSDRKRPLDNRIAICVQRTLIFYIFLDPSCRTAYGCVRPFCRTSKGRVIVYSCVVPIRFRSGIVFNDILIGIFPCSFSIGIQEMDFFYILFSVRADCIFNFVGFLSYDGIHLLVLIVLHRYFEVAALFRDAPRTGITRKHTVCQFFICDIQDVLLIQSDRPMYLFGLTIIAACLVNHFARNMEIGFVRLFHSLLRFRIRCRGRHRILLPYIIFTVLGWVLQSVFIDNRIAVGRCPI